MNDSSQLISSTKFGLDPKLLSKIQNASFCIVGCGGVGAYFAEMLVRTGATKINLIDADKVKQKNLNRTPFVYDDIGEFKVVALKKRLNEINATAVITTINRHFGCYMENDKPRQEIRELVVDSDITLIAVDKNRDRIECENLLNDSNKQYLVIGVEINNQIDASARYVCGWMTKTDRNEIDKEGYGENNGSYMSIVLEAVSTGFNLMMHHMKDGDSKINKYIERKYINYFPVDSIHEQ